MTLYNIVCSVTATLGTADVVVGVAVTGYKDWTGVPNGAIVSYGIRERVSSIGSLLQTEVGIGVWDSGTSTLARTVTDSTNGGAKIVLVTGYAEVYITPLKADFHDPITIGTASGLSLAGQVLSLGLASALVPGALSAADWSTFNAKQNALGYTPLNPANNLSDLSNVATARINLGLVIGTNVQAFDATLTSIALLGTVADKIPYTTAVDTWAETTLTAFARTILDDANAATVRATIGAGTGSGDLLAANNLSDVANAATARTNLGLAIGTNVQAFDATLLSIAGLGTAADKMIYTTALDTWAEATLTSFARTFLDDANAAAVLVTIGAQAALGYTPVDIASANYVDLTDGGPTTLHSHAGGTSLPVADTQTIVMGSADNTKLLRFEVDGFTTGTTRVLTPPNANATIAGLEVENVFTVEQVGPSWRLPVSVGLGPIAIFSTKLSSNTGNYAGFTIRQFISSAQLSNTGRTRVRVTFQSDSTLGGTITKAYIGMAATSGDAYDFDTTPVQITWNGGSTSVTLAAGETKASDTLTFTVETGKNLIISFYQSGAIGYRVSTSVTGSIQYYKAGDSASEVNTTGYAGDTNKQTGVSLVEAMERYGIDSTGRVVNSASEFNVAQSINVYSTTALQVGFAGVNALLVDTINQKVTFNNATYISSDGSVTLPWNVALRGTNFLGTATPDLIKIGSSDIVMFGDVSLAAQLSALNYFFIGVGGTSRLVYTFANELLPENNKEGDLGSTSNYWSRLFLSPLTSTLVPLNIKGAASQTGDLVQLQKSDGTIYLRVQGDGDLEFDDGVNIIFDTTTGTKIGTATSQKLGLWNVTPVVQPAAYTITNDTPDRTLDCNSTTLDELADLVGTLIKDVQSWGGVG